MSLKEYPTSGAELPALDEFQHLAMDLIEPSLTNPRKHFDATKLAELAESIKASGVHQPVLVRPLPGSRVEDTAWIPHRAQVRPVRPTYELVCGERRLRAAKIAGLATIPARILMMSDDQVLETQIVENLQRDDLSALEEAEGYEQLCTATGIRKEDIGAKIGKSRTYVYGRLKLLDLCPECQQAMRYGNLDASRALLLARIPDHQLQLKALDEATRIMFGGAVPSVRDLQTWLQRNVMLRLEAAPFVPADSQLVAAAGACNVCPKRTGANPDLFSDVDGADICTDPPCYRAKEEAHRADVLATAAKRGMTLIEGDDAKEIIHHQYARELDGYSRLSQVRADTVDGQSVQLGVLLGKDAPGTVLIENPWSKELIAAVPTAEAEAVLLARGLIKATTPKAPKQDIEGDIARIKKQAERDIDKAFRAAAFDALVTAVHSTRDSAALDLLSADLLRAWMLGRIEEEDEQDMCTMFDIEIDEDQPGNARDIEDAICTQLRLHIQACDSASLYRALAIWLILEDRNTYYMQADAPTTLFHAAAEGLKVDLFGLRKEAASVISAKTAGELKKLKSALKAQTAADPKTPDTTSAPAAQAKGVGGQAKSQKAPLRKPKLSAKDAQAAIAAAMQESEGSNPGAFAQNDNLDSSQPVDPAVAIAPAGSQAVESPAPGELTAEQVASSQQVFDKEGAKAKRATADKATSCAYRGPNGESWTGRGLMPRWMSELIKETGGSREDYRVAPTVPVPFSANLAEPGTIDPEYSKAVAIVQKHKKPSISLVQRHLAIGYNRAARLIEEMENNGVVGPMNRSGQRALLNHSEGAAA